LLSIQAFLTNPDPNEPFNDEGWQAREMLLSNPDKYNRTVQRWVQLYATPFADLRPLHLVLNAAASCPIFDARSLRAHYLQPPAPLAPTLSPRSLERALLQELLFRDNKQRVQLMCCSASLSTVACRLSGVSNRSEACQHWQVIGSIMKRCFSIFAARARTREPFHQPFFLGLRELIKITRVTILSLTLRALNLMQNNKIKHCETGLQCSMKYNAAGKITTRKIQSTGPATIC
jgi:hypothetical protein